jgi:hypothetical protein
VSFDHFLMQLSNIPKLPSIPSAAKSPKEDNNISRAHSVPTVTKIGALDFYRYYD